MGQNASKSKSELKTTESLQLQRLQTEIRERTEMETEMNQADDNKSDEKMKRRDSDFIMSRNIKEGNKALDFLGEYHLLNALNKEGISNLNTNLFLGLNADSLPISSESLLKHQEEASSMYADAYDSNLIQSSAAHLMKKKMAKAITTSKATALLVDGILEEQSKNKFKKFANVLQHPRGSGRNSETEESRRSRKSYFREPCRKCGEDDEECVHVQRDQRDSIASKPRNSEGFSKLMKKSSQGQINPKLLEDLEKMRASIQKVQSINIIKEDKEPSEVEEDVSSNEQSQNSQSVFNIASQNPQNIRFTFNKNDNLKSARLRKEEEPESFNLGNDRKKKLMLKISTEPTLDPRVCEKVAKREQVPVVYANLVNQRYTKRSKSPEKHNNKSAQAIRPVSPPSQSGVQTPVLQSSFLNKTHDIAFSKAENVVFPNKYSGYKSNFNNPNYPSLHLDTINDYSPTAAGPATTRTPYQAQSSQLEAYYHKRYTPTQSTTSLTPKSHNEIYSRKVEFQPTTPTSKSRNEISHPKYVQYVPYVNPANLSQSYNHSPQPLRVEFDLSMMQPSQSQENFYSRKTEYIPYTGGIQPGVYKNLNTPLYRYTDTYTAGRDYRGQERATYVRTQPPLQDHYQHMDYTNPVNRTSYENMAKGAWVIEDSHRKWQPSHAEVSREFRFPAVQKAVGLGYGRNF